MDAEASAKKLDRELQRRLLERLRDAYPRRDHHGILEGVEDKSAEEEKIIANLIYLEEYGLIESGVRFGLDDYATVLICNQS